MALFDEVHEDRWLEEPSLTPSGQNLFDRNPIARVAVIVLVIATVVGLGALAGLARRAMEPCWSPVDDAPIPCVFPTRLTVITGVLGVPAVTILAVVAIRDWRR